MWQQWANALLGLWVVIVPFWGFSMISFTWVLMATGVAIASLALWSAGRQMNERDASASSEEAPRHRSRIQHV